MSISPLSPIRPATAPAEASPSSEALAAAAPQSAPADPLAPSDAVAVEFRNGRTTVFDSGSDGRIHARRDANGPHLGFLGRVQAKARDFLVPANYPTSVSADYAPYRRWSALANAAATGADFFATQGIVAGLGVNVGLPMMALVAYFGKDALNGVGQFIGGAVARKADVDPKAWYMRSQVLNNSMRVAQSALVTVPGAFLAVAPVTNAVKAFASVMDGAAVANIDNHQAIAHNVGEMKARNGNQNLVSGAVGSGVAVGLSVAAQALLGPLGPPLAAAGMAGMAIFASHRAAKALKMDDLTDRVVRRLAHRQLAGSALPSPTELAAGSQKLPKGTKLEVGCGLSDLVKNPARFDRLRTLYADDHHLLDFDGKKIRVALHSEAQTGDVARAVFEAQLVSEFAASPAYRRLAETSGVEAASLRALELAHAATPTDFTAVLGDLKALGWNTDRVAVDGNPTTVNWKPLPGAATSAMTLEEFRQAMQ